MPGAGNKNTSNQMIDTHCHLYDASFDDDFTQVMLRAKTSGVSGLILPNIDNDSWSPLLSRVASSEIPCYPMLGLHPCYVKEDYVDQLNQLHTELIKHLDSIVAIGEIGLDLYWDKTFQAAQEQALREQIQWALTYNLPIALHVRDAFEPLFKVLADFKNTAIKGVFHCFTGGHQEAEHILINYPSFYFGIGGVLTYKKSGLQDVVKTIPLNRILLETDAPYLPPTPHRGKRNEPAFLEHIAEALSDALSMPTKEIEQHTTMNAQELFNLKKPE